eukprot:TRINITY_DN855_c0_g3_i3.p1 TRINITY_DN855_c0_g3~~TRINITY_DN855_c0_g3_i3.p1  ORF type:complete len:493 (+),score=136.04 TRINITY_DN855_c0_g3_i3:65-1480(+)
MSNKQQPQLLEDDVDDIFSLNYNMRFVRNDFADDDEQDVVLDNRLPSEKKRKPSSRGSQKRNDISKKQTLKRTHEESQHAGNETQSQTIDLCSASNQDDQQLSEAQKLRLQFQEMEQKMLQSESLVTTSRTTRNSRVDSSEYQSALDIIKKNAEMCKKLDEHSHVQDPIKLLSKTSSTASSHSMMEPTQSSDHAILSPDHINSDGHAWTKTSTGPSTTSSHGTVPDETDSQPTDRISLKIRDSHTPRGFKINVDDCLSKIVDLLSDALGVAADRIKLDFDGQTLNPDRTPSELELEDGDLIDLLLAPEQQTNIVDPAVPRTRTRRGTTRVANKPTTRSSRKQTPAVNPSVGDDDCFEIVAPPPPLLPPPPKPVEKSQQLQLLPSAQASNPTQDDENVTLLVLHQRSAECFAVTLKKRHKVGRIMGIFPPQERLCNPTISSKGRILDPQQTVDHYKLTSADQIVFSPGSQSL